MTIPRNAPLWVYQKDTEEVDEDEAYEKYVDSLLDEGEEPQD
jgi:3-oxoacyl-ACP reductase-like protein